MVSLPAHQKVAYPHIGAGFIRLTPGRRLRMLVPGAVGLLDKARRDCTLVLRQLQTLLGEGRVVLGKLSSESRRWLQM